MRHGIQTIRMFEGNRSVRAKILLKTAKHLFFDEPRYLAKSKIRFGGADRFQTSVLKSVERQGYFIAENFFDQKTTTKMKDASLLFAEETRGKGSNIFFPNFGVDRYLGVDAKPETATFFSDYFDDIGRRYVGGRGVRYQSMFEKKGSLGRISSADIPHFDDWKKRFKIFLYLNDVTGANCPFVVYENSYQRNLARKAKEIEYVISAREGSYGHLCPNEETKLLGDASVKRVTLTANSGSVIFVDTRFVHCGTPSQAGQERLLLASYFDIRKAN